MLADVTASICHSEAQLIKRNGKLEGLHALDGLLRSLHATAEWRDCESARSRIQQLAVDRQTLCSELIEMGAKPWHFNVSEDNSWLCGPRKSNSVKLVGG